MRTPAAYIEAAGILALPVEFPWNGRAHHYGPSQGTKLHDALGTMNACALTTTSALMFEWLVWRVHRATEVERALDFVDSVLAWEIDLRYRDRDGARFTSDDSPSNEALGDAEYMLRIITDDDVWEYPEVNVPSAASLANIVKQTLPTKAKKAFTSWLDATIVRAAKLEPYPEKERPDYLDYADQEEFKADLRPYFGKALPREALDPTFDYRPEQRTELLSTFLAQLDWSKNPFLRNPLKMKELGFEGTPYKL